MRRAAVPLVEAWRNEFRVNCSLYEQYTSIDQQALMRT